MARGPGHGAVTVVQPSRPAADVRAARAAAAVRPDAPTWKRARPPSLATGMRLPQPHIGPFSRGPRRRRNLDTGTGTVNGTASPQLCTSLGTDWGCRGAPCVQTPAWCASRRPEVRPKPLFTCINVPGQARVQPARISTVEHGQVCAERSCQGREQGHAGPFTTRCTPAATSARTEASASVGKESTSNQASSFDSALI